jgi:glycoside/pentoside/hexuronide:cation symporter, GPH family
VWVARRYSKRSAWMAGSMFAAAGYLGFWLNADQSMPVVIGWIVLVGMGMSCFAITYWAMLPDTVEYNEWLTGTRNEAKIAGFAVFAQKSALAVNAFLLGQTLDRLGFVANQALAADALAGIKATMCLVPLAGVVGSVVILWKYPISPQFHRTIVDQIAARSAATAAAAGERRGGYDNAAS